MASAFGPGAFSKLGKLGSLRGITKIQGVASAAVKSSSNLVEDVLKLTTSSRSLALSRTYTIFDGSVQLYKFGVTGENLFRMHVSRLMAGPGAKAVYSLSPMPKYQAHLMEKIFEEFAL
ncbi:MAG: hypothetical protein DI538_19885 [Azospira oryzae]|nr:MAG: hypothetical protein DI538_19885 [Azospira oryzae]